MDQKKSLGQEAQVLKRDLSHENNVNKKTSRVFHQHLYKRQKRILPGISSDWQGRPFTPAGDQASSVKIAEY